MAIKSDYTIHGVTIPECYIRLGAVHSVRHSLVVAVIQVFRNAGDPEAGIPELVAEPKHLPFTYETGDIYQWAYNQLKSLPEFAGALDV